MEAFSQREPLFLAPQPVDASTGRLVIQKVLIANRGEIACRVIATCRKLQIRTVLIYVQEDADLRHVVEADEAINVGSISAHAVNPFLNIDLLVQTAIDTNANAVHPGYGYLSENADFATRVAEAGLIFLGPSPSAMSTLGDKRRSKKYLQDNAPDVPLIPGFSGSSQQVADLEKAAHGIGFPVMLKASAGGGGKGMRIVWEAAQLRDELERAQSEASRSFGSSDCILEKYVESSKHVEIQIVGDRHGNVASFFERECSIQRRHQKVIEESPCIFLSDDVRREMGETAVRIAKLIGYENAGTVEFVVDVKTSRFFFLEVNARLQVEHPITEEVTGIDLVALQLFVAAGGNLTSLPQINSLKQTGHAIESRLCAEDPARDFFPEHGKVHIWRPADGPLGPGRDVRYETAIQTGSSVSIYFDSMIAKIVVWAPTRQLAVEKMTNVLAHTACVGVKTNQLFLQRCLVNPMFQDPRYNTSFINQNLDQLRRCSDWGSQEASRVLATAIPSLFIRKLPHHLPGTPRRRPFQNIRKQFRNQHHDSVSVHCDVVTGDWPGQNASTEQVHPVLCLWEPQTLHADLQSDQVKVIPLGMPEISEGDKNGKGKTDGPSKAAQAVTSQYNYISNKLRRISDDLTTPTHLKIVRWIPISDTLSSNPSTSIAATLEISIHGQRLLAHCVTPCSESGLLNHSQVVFCHIPLLGTFAQFQRHSLLSYTEGLRSTVAAQIDEVQNDVLAPMPCKVLSLQKSLGDEVKIGESVMVIESMKMEVSIKASKAGRFESSWKAGDAVEEGKVLCRIE
ncbi:carbamoyl-phosphate synthase L chain, ATP binding domain-containing protein [Dactylonectria macrodidyma]|uniref:Carbamoyl-phosphate synthase L chain, ATP binding domain-containing protein n=1 Tax=Dactylonectria macrodidyma TaxID=307937 RepID=A0A9P9FVR2_9HYPO|nr:carbamoyl-phosphate synthase L chain, ATP binding domain-containing protein [Dactylonectria macrodidyma]